MLSEMKCLAFYKKEVKSPRIVMGGILESATRSKQNYYYVDISGNTAVVVKSAFEPNYQGYSSIN